MKFKKLHFFALLLILSFILLFMTCKKTVSVSSHLDDIKSQVEMSH